MVDLVQIIGHRPEAEKGDHCQVKNVVLCLAENSTQLWDTTIICLGGEYMKYSIRELLSTDVMRTLCITQQRLAMDNE